MTEEEMIVKITKHDEEIKNLKHRVTETESKQETINELVLSVNKLAVNMEHMLDEQKEQGERLKKLEVEPLDNAKYYRRQIIGCAITAVVGAIIGALIGLLL